MSVCRKGKETETRTAIVVTSIFRPGKAMTALAAGSRRHGCDLIVIGDTKTPDDFALEGSRYFDLEAQQATGFAFAERCPTGHYARKAIGYLIAIRDGATLLIETDDDNIPRPEFFARRIRKVSAPALDANGWINVYRYFSDQLIWPRGLPLDAIATDPPSYAELPVKEVDCPIQQGLCDDNPDVDAIHRLILPDPVRFRADRRVALGRGGWCPFNSQNTTWWPETFPLLYLPAYCSFRMTDIWRSLIAQRIAWENGWAILFHGPTMRQERNDHDLMRDFSEEIPGYLNNRRIAEVLAGLRLKAGTEHIPDNLRRCYAALADLQILDERETQLLEAWLADLAALAVPAAAPPAGAKESPPSSRVPVTGR